MPTRKRTTIKKSELKTVSKRKASFKKASKKITGLARPPVVTLMGHVDHGKTTLLDAIRKSHQVDKEFGGITQHIGSYQITYKGKKITFIDTPGHAAFSKMRAHGVQVTDLVILVIAADDGVKPQTREALDHIKAAKVPYLVAFNKIDLPDINIERIKGELAEESVVLESYGGDIVAVEVSAKTGKNLDKLLEMIILISEMQELKADPKGDLEAVVIETRQDKKRGMLATLIVKNGTLTPGQCLDIAGQKIKIRAMFDENGKNLNKALPGSPVEILGFKSIPAIGQLIGSQEKVQSETKIKQIEGKEIKDTNDRDEKDVEEEEKQNIKVILKTDTMGSLEAILSNLSDEVEIIGKGVGEVTESDILLAQATGASVYAFNCRISSSAQKLAEVEKITVKTYKIIYKLFEDLEKQVLKLLEPTIDEEEVGSAQVIAEFKIKKERIAGCKIIEGEIQKSSLVHLKRGEEIIADSKIKSLQKGKELINKVKKGNECGMTFKPIIDFKINDVIISYRIIDH